MLHKPKVSHKLTSQKVAVTRSQIIWLKCMAFNFGAQSLTEHCEIPRPWEARGVKEGIWRAGKEEGNRRGMGWTGKG